MSTPGELRAAAEPPDRSRCPLCARPNDCRLCTREAYKGTCWCEAMLLPQELLERVPLAQRDQACICARCVQAYHRARVARHPILAGPGDFTVESGGLLVFTAHYLLRRGFCCGSGCRNCPYPGEVRRAAGRPAELA